MDTALRLNEYINIVNEYKMDKEIAFGMLEEWTKDSLKEEEPSPHHLHEITEATQSTSNSDQKQNDEDTAAETDNMEFQHTLADLLSSDPDGNETNGPLLSNLVDFIEAAPFVPAEQKQPSLPPAVHSKETVIAEPNCAVKGQRGRSKFTPSIAPIVEEEEECISPLSSFTATKEIENDEDSPHNASQMNRDEDDEKEDDLPDTNNDSNKPEMHQFRQWLPQQPQKYQFRPKLPNHAKGNFYITKEIVSRIVHSVHERFRAQMDNDEKLAFSHIKESIAMQINDGQITVMQTVHGEYIIIIHIDLHYRANGKVMYLVAIPNDARYRKRVPWQIAHLMTSDEILATYGVIERDLPVSSRPKLIAAVQVPPSDGYFDYRVLGIYHVNFRHLPHKLSKRRSGDITAKPINISISEQELRRFIEKSFLDEEVRNTPMVPVVVIKGKQQFVEWKKFVRIIDSRNQYQWFAISLQLFSHRWRISCLDFDAGRIYYQHRLLQLDEEHAYCFSHADLVKYVTICKLSIH